jgi:hypothetical protein
MDTMTNEQIDAVSDLFERRGYDATLTIEEIEAALQEGDRARSVNVWRVN